MKKNVNKDIVENKGNKASERPKEADNLKQITYCNDGKYRWVYEFNMWRNPSILLTVLKIFAYIIFTFLNFTTVLFLIIRTFALSIPLTQFDGCNVENRLENAEERALAVISTSLSHLLHGIFRMLSNQLCSILHALGIDIS